MEDNVTPPSGSCHPGIPERCAHSTAWHIEAANLRNQSPLEHDKFQRGNETRERTFTARGPGICAMTGALDANGPATATTHVRSRVRFDCASTDTAWQTGHFLTAGETVSENGLEVP
jgi:hypothetical protein